MVSNPTPEECAHHVLSTFKILNRGAGRILQTNNFHKPFTGDGWQISDFNTGVAYAIQKGWVEKAGGVAFRLTEEGLAVTK
ncbi:MAG: hypothetical protein HOL37_06880 [Rhodospirillaceae bacterium]|jgi:hypothetical protein|nr:hypothetical protein [Rhodospirillaceae bacterium]MBT5014207.1 hypothetical protein [Rhodospirillaceae bacterium]MBT5309041.1 hypothetical protein [Rhodospirillaceae bacterium]MBT7357027.1 hypothetical protein [Rhodospirillaceae bacterium]